MRPLWLELLLTPMAAPETRWLRAMRVTLLVGFVSVAAGILNLAWLDAAIGGAARGCLVGLCFALIALVPYYLIVKTRADSAFLFETAERDEP